MISEHGAAFCGVRPPWAAGSRQRAERTRFSPLFRRERNNDRNARFACGRAFCSVCWHKQKRKRGCFLFFLSKGGRFLFLIGERFLFLKKRNKRHCGERFSFGEKDVSRTSDPIVQKNGRFVCEPSVLCNTLAKATGTQKESCSAIDFLLLPFLSRKKRKTPISAAVQWRGSRPRLPPYRRSPPRPRCNGPYDPSE